MNEPDGLRAAMAKRVYVKSESHLSGYRLVIGFETLDTVQNAHSELVQGDQYIAGTGAEHGK
jgi:hypothetical protein